MELLRRTKPFSFRSPLASIAGLVYLQRGIQSAGRRDLEGAERNYAIARKAYERAGLLKGIGLADVFLGLAIQHLAERDERSYASVMETYQRALATFAEMEAEAEVELVKDVRAEARLAVVSVKIVKEQLQALPYISSDFDGDEIDLHATRMARIFSRMSDEDEAKFGAPLKYGHVPISFMEVYFKSDAKLPETAQQVSRWHVVINMVDVQSWVTYYHNLQRGDDSALGELKGPELRQKLTVAERAIRTAALREDFRRVFVNRHGAVGAEGVRYVIEKLFEIPALPASPVDEAESNPEAVQRRISDENRSRIFYRLIESKERLSSQAFDEMIAVAEDLIAAGDLSEGTFTPEGRLTEDGLEEVVGIAKTHVMNLFPDDHWSAVVTMPKRRQGTDDEVRNYKEETPPLVVKRLLADGVMKINAIDENTGDQRALGKVYMRIGRVAQLLKRRIDDGMSNRGFVMAKQGRGWRVNLTAMRETAALTDLSYQIEDFLGRSYPAIARQDQDYIWRKIVSTLARLSLKAQSETTGEGGVKDEYLRWAYETSEIAFLLGARFRHFNELDDVVREQRIEAVFNILSRKDYETRRISADGSLEAAVVIQAYDSFLSGRSRIEDTGGAAITEEDVEAELVQTSDLAMAADIDTEEDVSITEDGAEDTTEFDPPSSV